MQEEADLDIAKLVAEVHRRYGRNMLCFQEIEVSLKLILPYLHPDGSKKGLDALKEYLARVRTMTLGQLANELQACEGYPEELVGKPLQEVRSARNLLAHEFYRTHAADLRDRTGVEKVLIGLDQAFHQVRPLHELLTTHALGIVMALAKENPEILDGMHADWSALVARVPKGTEIICGTDPTKTIWETTRVVALLRRAEKETEPAEGLTLLSRAGAFIRREEPDLDYREYGLKKLIEIVQISGFFDVFEQRGGDGQRKIYAYRSKG